MECKFWSFEENFVEKVLVEVAPYWNVNEAKLNEIETNKEVEVAPYWNVNSKLIISDL